MPHSGVALIDPKPIFDKIGLNSGMRVADLGCGRTGHFVFPSSRVVGDKGIVYAVDIIKNILESIASQSKAGGYHNVQTIWSDIEKPGKVKIPENSLDVCFFVNVMFLIKDKESAMKEAKRLLKDDRYLVIVDWNKTIGPVGPAKEQMVDFEALEQTAFNLNLKLVDKISINEYHYAVILKKI